MRQAPLRPALARPQVQVAQLEQEGRLAGVSRGGAHQRIIALRAVDRVRAH